MENTEDYNGAWEQSLVQNNNFVPINDAPTNDLSADKYENFQQQSVSNEEIYNELQALKSALNVLEEKINICIQNQGALGNLITGLTKIIHDLGSAGPKNVSSTRTSIIDLQKDFDPKFTTIEQIKKFDEDLKSNDYFLACVSISRRTGTSPHQIHTFQGTFFKTKSSSALHVSVKQMVATFLDPCTRELFTAQGYGEKKSFSDEYTKIKACILTTNSELDEKAYKEGLALFFKRAGTILKENELKRRASNQSNSTVEENPPSKIAKLSKKDTK